MKTTTLRTALPGNVSTVILYVAMLTLVDTVFRDIWVSYRNKTLSLYTISPKTFLLRYVLPHCIVPRVRGLSTPRQITLWPN